MVQSASDEDMGLVHICIMGFYFKYCAASGLYLHVACDLNLIVLEEKRMWQA